ncbi:uncharacterized protein IUM83_18541 [Phytophthora cinnamomi]|uniref:uncharacterized protein n=1 Tax=Phytophthora cinnamomi TaxID=4785 RepID=UPI0035597893|nr:hypothetical protein IUM83_18541 [Phytophthora cinnamomi]
MNKSPRSCCDSLLVACDDLATLEAALNLIDDCSDDPLTEPITPDQTRDLDATLDGVSEFLDHVDIPQISLELSDANEPIRPVDTVAVPTQKKRGRTTPKQEIAQLRAQERELACRLENLRLQAYDRKQRGGPGKNTNVLPFWKKIASRQYQSRLDSERENRRLRSLVAMHVGRAKRLKIAWKKQMATEGYQEKPSVPDQLVHGIIPPDTPALLKRLEEEADDVYADLEAFISGARPLLKGHIPFIKHSDTYTLPFDQLTVGTAMWHALGARFRGNEQHIHATDSTITCCVVRKNAIENQLFEETMAS